MTDKKPGDWMENFTIQSSGVHFLLGYSIMYSAATMMRVFSHVLWVQAALILFVGIKEFWYDPKYETNEGNKSGAIDAAGYVLGCLLAWGVVLWKMMHP
jgi:hypothetical protein